MKTKTLVTFVVIHVIVTTCTNKLMVFFKLVSITCEGWEVQKSPPFWVLTVPSLNNVSIPLQKMQATYIWCCAMVVGLTTSCLPSLVDPPNPHIQLTHSYKYMSKYVLNGYWGQLKLFVLLFYCFFFFLLFIYFLLPFHMWFLWNTFWAILHQYWKVNKPMGKIHSHNVGLDIITTSVP
jgi:hypothetical protein